MTDERLDKILKQSLVPEISADDIFQYEKARKRKIMFILKRLGVGTAAAVAILAAGIATIGLVDPALASKIPLIGSIFEETEDNLTFSGDYSEKATVLSESETEDTMVSKKYTAQDQGFNVTASEVYSDGYSIYLTLQIESEEEDFSYIPEFYTQSCSDDTDAKTAVGIYSYIDWSVAGTDLKNTPHQLVIVEGKVIDEHTFAGMIKIDLPDCLMNEQTLDLSITSIGYDDIRPEMQDNTTESASHRFEGEWRLEIPVTVDPDVKLISVDENYGNYTLKNVMVSDSQVVVDTRIPTLSDISQDELDEYLKEHSGIFDYPDMYDYFGIPYVTCETYVFNQDGELLTPVSELDGLARFAVQGKELTELHIYIFDNPDYGFDIIKGRMGEEEATSLAVISKEIILD